jgi:hypothetical protein
MIRLAVLLAQETTNADGLPAEWPVSVEEVTDDRIIDHPYVEMSLLQYEQHRASYQTVYDAWETNRELGVARAKKIERLWQSAYDFNFQYFSGGAYAQILELKLAGVARALDNQNWILTLWGDYYMRKYQSAIATNFTELDAVSEDFSNHGAPPWTVLEMLSSLQG